MDAEEKEALEHKGWKKVHLSPTLSYGHLLTTVGMVVSVVLWGGRIDNQVSTLVEERRAIAERADKDRLEIKSELNRALDKAESDRKELKADLKSELADIKQSLNILNRALSRNGNDGNSRPR